MTIAITKSTHIRDAKNQIHLNQKLAKICIIAQISQLVTTAERRLMFSVQSTSEVLNSSNIVRAKSGEATIRPNSQL